MKAKPYFVRKRVSRATPEPNNPRNRKLRSDKYVRSTWYIARDPMHNPWKCIFEQLTEPSWTTSFGLALAMTRTSPAALRGFPDSESAGRGSHRRMHFRCWWVAESQCTLKGNPLLTRGALGLRFGKVELYSPSVLLKSGTDNHRTQSWHRTNQAHRSETPARASPAKYHPTSTTLHLRSPQQTPARQWISRSC